MKLIQILFCPFPEGAHNKLYGVTRLYNGQYQILIDNLQPEERQQRTLRHEYAHMMLGHLKSTEPEPEYPSPEYDAREKAADDYADAMTEAEFSALLYLSDIKHEPEVVTA